MNKYSAALRHINMNDVKQKHQQKLIEYENKLKDEIEEKKYIQSVMETKRYNWRDEIKTIDKKIEDVVENVNNKQYDWREKLLTNRKKYFEEGMTSSNFYTTGQQGEVDLSTSVDVPTEFTGGIIPGHNFTVSRFAQVPVDYSNYNSIVVNISGGGGASSWSDNTPGTFTPGVYAVFYAVDNNGNLIGLNGDLNGGYPRTVPPFGTLPTIDTLLNSGTNTLTIPSNLKQGNLRLLIYQNANTDPNIVGGVTPPTTFNSITLKGKTPINVFVSLDNPEATSFVRTGSGNLSPGEKLNRLKEMLKASDNYLQQIYGSDFPGTGAEPPGESRFTSQQLSDIDKQIQDLQAQSEKNKQDAVNNQWKAAAELGLGVAGVVGGIGAAAKIPAAVRAAQTVSQVRQATRAYNTYKALEKIKDAAATNKMTRPGTYTAKPPAGGTTPKGGGMYKS